MKFNRLDKLKEAFLKKEDEEYALKKANLWSSISLIGSKLMIDKQEDEKEIEKERRRFLECLIRRVILDVEKINQRLNEIKTALISCRYDVKEVKIKTLSRALVGGSETFGEIPFEVGLHFDPIMNVPYIPGSTIKGAVRSATFEILYKEKFQKEIEQEKNKKKADEEAKEYAEQECRKIFGGPIKEERNIGLIGFTDAYPVEKGEQDFLLYPDVMTPHYKNVGTELDVMPTPIIYLTIAPETKFRFYMFYKRKRGKRELSISDLVDNPIRNQLGIVDRGLLYAFIRGVGAKTALGYSRFEILNYEKVSR
jgi:CRISPR-associated protein Cmr6